MVFVWWGIGTLIFYKAMFAALLSPYDGAHLGLVSVLLMAIMATASIFLSARPYAGALGRTLGRALFENADTVLFWRFAWWVPFASSGALIVLNWLIIYGFSPRLARIISFDDPWRSWFSYGTRYLLICTVLPIFHAVITTMDVAASLRRAAELRGQANA